MSENQQEVVKFDPTKPQEIIITLSKTGETGWEMPGSIQIDMRQVTARHVLYCAFSLLDKAYQQFKEEGGDTPLSNFLHRACVAKDAFNELARTVTDKLETKDKKDDK